MFKLDLFPGVDTGLLIGKPVLEGLPDRPPRLLYYNDYNKIETTPSYKKLSLKSRYKLFLGRLYVTLYSTYLGRLYFNLNYTVLLFFLKYFPYLAFFRFGFKQSFTNIFSEDPTDNTIPKPNSDYYSEDEKPVPWYRELLAFIW